MASRTIVLILLIACAGIAPERVNAQSQEKLYAVMILNFAKGISWPAFNSSTFNIGVMGYPPLEGELNASSANTKIHGRRIRVKAITDASQATDCQIVFIPAFNAKYLEQVVQASGNAPVLIVTNKNEMIRKGGGVDLVLLDGRLTYVINCKGAERRGMKVSNAIRTMGRVLDL